MRIRMGRWVMVQRTGVMLRIVGISVGRSRKSRSGGLIGIEVKVKGGSTYPYLRISTLRELGR
jgi:hypothetical protein